MKTGRNREERHCHIIPIIHQASASDNSSGVRTEALWSNKPPLLLIILGLFRINLRALSEDCGRRSDVVSDAAPQTCYTKTRLFIA